MTDEPGQAVTHYVVSLSSGSHVSPGQAAAMHVWPSWSRCVRVQLVVWGSGSQITLRLRHALLLKGLRHVQRFREPRAKHPAEAVADLEAGVLDSAGESVPGAGASECEE